MKFRFCGDADCPDWLLMQINTLSGLSLNHFQEMCEAVADSLQGREINYTKIKELGKEAKIDNTDLKACISGLCFALRSGTTYGVPSNELGAELEQLGLEPSHAESLTSVYSKCYEGLRNHAVSAILRTPAPKNIIAEPYQEGIKVHFSLEDKNVSVSMTKQQASLLLQDLKAIAERMDALMPSNDSKDGV